MRLRLLSCLAAASAALALPSLKAQTSNIAPRIVQAVDDSNRVTLKGNVTALARPQFDRGEADPATQLTFVRLVLSRSPEQEAALDQFMAQQLDKSSPNYHKWLTPQQFGKLYGPADSDIAIIEAWLESHGLHVESVSTGRTDIAFSGSVSQIEDAFQTRIHSFNANGRQFLSNNSDPSIPAAIAPVVSGVAHLNTLQPRSHAVRGPSASYDPKTKRFVSAQPGQIEVRPELTLGSSGNQSLYVVAGDAATIYDTPNSYNAGFSSGSSYNGQGVTIGIGGNGLIQASTVQNYRKLFLGDTTAPTITIVSSAVANADTDEAYLDTEIAGGLAPGATIDFYVDANLDNAISKALNDNKVDIFSLSFGECEMNLTTADNNLINGWWKQAAGQGIAVTVSTGDSGSAGCDNENTEHVAIDGLQVSGFSTTPYNIAVGGTDYYGLLGGFSAYAGSTNSASSFYRTALKYIPESTWNDTAQSDGMLSANIPYLNGSSQTNITGGTGGASSCSTNTTTSTTVGTCTSGYAKPSWQRGTGVPSDGVRDVPDVSLLAGNGFDGASWLVCSDDVNNGTADNCAVSNNSFSFVAFGGTSASAPAFAGILALVQQKAGGRLGNAAKTLYDLFNSTHASAVFHDVTQGNISVPCTSGTPNCSKNTAGYYYLTGYDTGAGYDLATGIGSVDASALVTYWGTATGNGAATVTPTPSATAITTAQSLTVNVSVTGSLGTPTGTVTLSGGGYSSAPTTVSSTGTASFTIAAGALAAGADTLTATYSGDSNYASTTGTTTVTVTAVAKLTPTVVVTPASATIDSAQSLNVAVAISGTGGTPTGTVTLTSGSYTSSAVTLTAGAGTITIPANTLGGGTATLTVTYSGDGVYATATATATVTVTQSVYSLGASAPAAVSAGASATSTITVASSTAYSGTVSLTCALSSSPSGASSLPTCSVSGSPVTLSSSSTSGTATVTINTTKASAQMQRPPIGGWMTAGGGTVLALLVFFGIPARRRRWRAMLGMIALLIAFGGFSACGGGGGGSSGNGGASTPATTSGNYTFTVTGTGNPAVTPAPTVNVTLTVN